MEPNPTITLLRALHDLDLGALAYNTRIAGDGLTPADLDVLCAAHTAQPSGYRAVLEATIMLNRSPVLDARELAALGAKVRAALPAEPQDIELREQVVSDLKRQLAVAQASAALWSKGARVLLPRLEREAREARQALADLRGEVNPSTAPLADQIRALRVPQFRIW